jgi:hypothetical protein
LIAALHGAVALADRDYVAAAVTENLDLDVAGVLDEFFQEHAAFLEVVFRQSGDGGKRYTDFGRFSNQRHANAATTGRAFQHNRISDTRGFRAGVLFIAQQLGTR